MTKRVQLKEHIQTLDQIGDIMTAMKNLSLIEINKVTKCVSMQEQIVNSIKAVGKDFLYFYPNLLPLIQVKNPSIYILIGSERGFCGGFNDHIVNTLNNPDIVQINSESKFIIVGRKLEMKMMNDKRIIQAIDGPNAAEEIPNIILDLIHSIETISLKEKLHPAYLTIIFCEENENKIQSTILQPFFEFQTEPTRHHTFPPILNLEPENFLFNFINNYLFSTLYFIFYKSYMAENYQRLHHLDNALDRLKKNIISLNRHLNLLRQEEITQEILVIMLSAEAVIEEIKK